jgi:hypothetical protein
MSYPGWQAIRAIERGEVELTFWLRYTDRLTPAERKRIGAGDYRSLVRPLEPHFKPGQWVEVSPKVSIRVVGTTFRRLAHRTAIGEVRDHRGGRAVDRTLHEDPENFTTIVPINDWPADPPEPEKVPTREVELLPATVAARAVYEREQQERRMEHEAQPLEARLAWLRQEAEESGVDLTRQLARIEQGIKAAESKMRRLSKSASDRAA